MKMHLALLFSLGTFVSMAQQPLKLWYTQPAEKWVEALPLGNGKIGAMVFGGLDQELIQLNESTLWSGGPVKSGVNPESPQYLSKIREALLKDEDYGTAEKLMRKMQGMYSQSYLPLGNLVIRQDFKGAKASAYYRELDIGNAVATTKFTVNGIAYVRELFISAPDNILVLRIKASKKGALNLSFHASSLLKHSLSAKNNNQLIVSGKAPANVNPNYYNPKDRSAIVYDDTTGCNGMRFQYRLKASSKDGQIKTVADTVIEVKNATEVLLYVAAATSFNGFDKCPDKNGKDEKQLAENLISKASKKPFDHLAASHKADYRKYFDRMEFQLKDTASNPGNSKLPSDKRLKGYSEGAYDPGLETLYFQFGRYLLISSSRPGSPPANLQGIWNKELRAPWSSNYTININTQMNYWPAEVTNLSEMHQPLLDWLPALAKTGSVTAREFYGAGGWVANHNSDIWAISNPVGDKGAGDPVWANWPMGAAWLSQHLYEHYRFTNDQKFLAEKAYPLMKGAAQFMLDWLIQDHEGHLVTAPSTTPENKFKDKKGKSQGVAVATTMDMSIIRDLFTNCIEAAQILEIDDAFRKQLIEKRSQLYPLKIGSKGQLLEWQQEFEEEDPQHRHVSHLFGLHPGREITPLTPTFFDAAKKTLEIRGDGGTGWSKGWKINWWARLQDGDHAYRLIRQLLNYVEVTTGSSKGGGTYPNFFDAHPPFQIDGNFAGTAGMSELLIQSHLDYIHLLPALPAAWPTGQIKGLRARGGFELAFSWKQGKLSTCSVVSNSGGRCVIRTNVPVNVAGLNLSSQKIAEGYQLTLNTIKGKTYQLSVK